jgi:hypothetical protein
MKTKKVAKANEPINYVIEDDVPIGTGRAIKTTPEYQIMDQMRVNQSVSFPPSKLSIFRYATSMYHKETEKRFIIRTVNKFTRRIFRIADNTKLKSKRNKNQ